MRRQGFTLLKLQGGLPSELALQLARVDGITKIMACAVCHVGDQSVAVSFGVAEQTVDGADDHLDKVDILPFIEAADIVSVGHFALMEYEVDGTGVIFDKEPVAHVLTLTVDRKWLAVTDIVDKQRYQLLGELIGAVVV